MSRLVAGTLLLPDGTPMAGASVYFTAKRTEPDAIVKGIDAFFKTNSTGIYSQEIENGWYTVTIEYQLSGTYPRRWSLGEVVIEDGPTTTLNALIIAMTPPDDPNLGVFQQLLLGAQEARETAVSASATAQAARDEAVAAATVAVMDPLRRAVEAASSGRMSVFYTAKGQPSYFVRVPAFNCEDVASGLELGTGVHEAFMFDGVRDSEIWIGAFAAAIIDGEAVCQPGLAPAVNINYDNARAMCQAAGAGFDLMTVWDWAAVMHWCMAHGFEPRGDTNYGRHHDNRWEVGTRQDGLVPGDSSGVGSILAGSGPAEWRHDGTAVGISDLVGNVWEWLSGMMMIDGRVNLALDNSIPPESAYSDTGFDMPTSRTWASIDVTTAPQILQRAGILPKGVNDPLGYLYATLAGERLPFRGGARNSGGNAGLGALSLSNSRTYVNSFFGFRPRFRNP